MRAPNGGATPSFCGKMLWQGLPGTMMRVPEFSPPRRSDSYEPTLKPEVVNSPWQYRQPPASRVVSGRICFENDTEMSGSLSVHFAGRLDAMPPSLVSLVGCSAPTSGSYVIEHAAR